ncbi:hypothetical protein [Microbacterium sp. NPDC058389]|uniref:hypothetical protein n=1 Tax=Microbacterium sp. NPDC058389 TaxID=3346475 RepID=UPI003647BEBA
MTTAPPAGTIAATRLGWRFWVALVAWTAVVSGFVLGLMTFGRLFALALGNALGSEPSMHEQVAVWRWFVGIAISLGAAAVAAAVAQRWVAFVLALLIAAACAFFAVGLFTNVRSTVAPVAPVEHVDPGPPPCACYSGSVCDCPGG